MERSATLLFSMGNRWEVTAQQSELEEVGRPEPRVVVFGQQVPKTRSPFEPLAFLWMR
jgi:hypothetical protein